jgi:putative spermidine/putrescine transport system permease protein
VTPSSASRSFDRTVAALAWASLAFLLFPVLFTLVSAFGGSMFIEFPPSSLSLRWFANIGEINRVGAAVVTSLGIALVAAALATLLGAAAALALARFPLPGKPVATALLLSPIALPVVAVGLALIQFFVMLGAEFTWWSLVAGHLVITLAYPVRTVAASLALSNPSLEEAAASLGATPWDAFRTVTLPQMAPGLVSGFLFAFLISFDNYPISVFLVRGDLTTLPIELFNHINQNLDPTPAAFSAVYVAAVSVAILLAERRWRILSLSVPR